jgi:hypothetical protein
MITQLGTLTNAGLIMSLLTLLLGICIGIVIGDKMRKNLMEKSK